MVKMVTVITIKKKKKLADGQKVGWKRQKEIKSLLVPLGSYGLKEPWVLTGFQAPLHPFSSLSKHSPSHPKPFAPAFPHTWKDFPPTRGLATAISETHISAVWSLLKHPSTIWTDSSLSPQPQNPQCHAIQFTCSAALITICYFMDLITCLLSVSPTPSSTVSSMRKITSYCHQLDLKTELYSPASTNWPLSYSFPYVLLSSLSLTPDKRP